MPSRPNSQTNIDKWLSVRISGNAKWPKERTTVSFGGHDLVLFPPTPDTAPSLHINLYKLSAKQGMTLINRFLSYLAWCEDAALENLGGVSGHMHPRPIPRQKEKQLWFTDVFPLSVKLAEDEKALRALALFREARSVNSIPFRLLSYFKILNIVWNDKKIKGRSEKDKNKKEKNEITKGIRDTLPKLLDTEAKDRIARLSQKGERDIPAYLYESGRCAVSHAYKEPIADPDNIEDLHRLSEDAWIIKAIAEYLMENTLMISRSFFG